MGYARFLDRAEEQYQHRIIMSSEEYKDWIFVERKKYSRSLTFFEGLFGLTEADILWKYQKRLRKTEYYFNTNQRLRYIISRIILHKKQFRYGMNVKLNSCGKGLHIMHIGPILTNGDIGEECSIHVNAMVVSGGREQKTPMIGNHVVIGVGAAIVGGVSIADYTAIGANSVVTKSFDEENIAIAGNPAKKISNNGIKTWGTKSQEEKQ